MLGFLHGVETEIIKKNGREIKAIKSSVICLVGTAPKGPVNELTLIVNDSDAALFGNKIPGFDIPHALEAIRAYRAGIIIVVNVFDPATMVASVAAETNVVTNYKFKLAFPPISGIVMTNSAGSTTYVKDTDYSIDDFGNVKILRPSVIAEGSTTKTTYNKLDATLVTAATIVGTINGGTNVKTGYKLLDEVYPTFGLTPKILVSPDWNTNTTVSAEMKAKADYWRAIFPLDAAAAIIPSAVITQRGPAGTNNISTNSPRAIICYPKLKMKDPDPSSAEDATILRPYSETMAGILAFVDLNEGYWVSPSNQEILNIVGPERKLTWIINKQDTEVNTLNSYGVTTLIKDSSYRTWGNRNASYPSEVGIDTFIPMQRLADVIHESIEFFAKPFVGKPITPVLVDTIVESVNSFFRTLQGRGAIIAGFCEYNPDNNPSGDLADGNVKFDYEFVGPTPAERITFRSFTNINLLKTIA
jgi:phage tail sheath protein FI